MCFILTSSMKSYILSHVMKYCTMIKKKDFYQLSNIMKYLNTICTEICYTFTYYCKYHKLQFWIMTQPFFLPGKVSALPVNWVTKVNHDLVYFTPFINIVTVHARNDEFSFLMTSHMFNVLPHGVWYSIQNIIPSACSNTIKSITIKQHVVRIFWYIFIT